MGRGNVTLITNRNKCNQVYFKKGMGDAEYLAAFQQIILPVAYQYNPQLVLVAAGFDSAIGDPLGGTAPFTLNPRC